METEAKILIIDDDVDLCKLMKKLLELEGYEVVVRQDGEAGLASAQSENFRLIILDITSAKLNGFDVMSALDEKCKLPVLMLTSSNSESEIVSSLSMCSDDYLTKPFYNNELVSRVQSLIWRYTLFNEQDSRTKQIITYGNLAIDYIKRETKFKDEILELTTKEFDLLYFLAKNAGIVFTKKQIYCAVWDDVYAFDDNNIMVHIRRLRKKIEPDPNNPSFILTVWGVGYKFAGERV